MVDLDPGDVLFVPARWWHYVENLSTAISINTWVPHVSIYIGIMYFPFKDDVI